MRCLATLSVDLKLSLFFSPYFALVKMPVFSFHSMCDVLVEFIAGCLYMVLYDGKKVGSCLLVNVVALM